MGGLHWNPLVRIKAISMRKDAIYYNLHMPWENTWLAAPTRYAAIRQALKTAGVQVKDINVTLGGCAFWHAVISIKKQPGEAKNALLAALSVMDLKHVVVVDDDIDVVRSDRGGMGDRHPRAGRQGHHDRQQARAQAARPEPAARRRRGADRRQGRHRRDHPRGHPEGALRAHHLRLCRHREDRRLRQGQGGRRSARTATSARSKLLAGHILAAIDKEPLYYTDIAERFSDYDFRTVARALGHLHKTEKLWQDPKGKMCVRGSKFAAVMPVKK